MPDTPCLWQPGKQMKSNPSVLMSSAPHCRRELAVHILKSWKPYLDLVAGGFSKSLANFHEGQTQQLHTKVLKRVISSDVSKTNVCEYKFCKLKQ